MTPSYEELDAESSKQSSTVISRRNSAQEDAGDRSTAPSKMLAEAFFERQAAVWTDRYRGGNYLHRRKLVAEIIGREVVRLNRPAISARLLDSGCGSGVVLKDAVRFGLRATGVDSSTGMINAARTELGRQVILEWLQSSSGEGNYEREEYDIVLCLSVLEFVRDVPNLLSRLCARVVKGGILVVSVPNRAQSAAILHSSPSSHVAALRNSSTFDRSRSYLNHSRSSIYSCPSYWILSMRME